MPTVALTQASLRELGGALSTEWLETNGLGAYAMSTPLLCNTRKYHGLLVTPLPGSSEPYNLLSKLEASLLINGSEFPLSVNRYPGVFHPQGQQYAEGFSLGESPRLEFRVGAATAAISVMMPYERPAVLVRYEVNADGRRAVLRLVPLLAYRISHWIAKENSDVDLTLVERSGGWDITPYKGMPPLTIRLSRNARFVPLGDWYRNFEYEREMERGYEYHEDLFTPGFFDIEIDGSATVVVEAGIEQQVEELDPAAVWDIESRRRRDAADSSAAVVGEADPGSGFAEAMRLLAHHSRHFLVSSKRNRKASIIAGFPWFGEWGRDAMISLPGLTLSRGMPNAALEILTTYATAERRGLFPNQLNVYGESSYNTVDASLWFFWAVSEYLKYTGDIDTVRSRFEHSMRGILEAYAADRVPSARIEANGLLAAGDKHTQLTWMDAEVNGVPVTPRHGFPVEINALWYHALFFFEQALGEDSFKGSLGRLGEVLPNLRRSFLDMFWLEKEQHLADVVTVEGEKDVRVRPNQIVAASLGFSPLSDRQALAVVQCVERELLTPYGLRTLSPTSYGYIGEYRGGQEERDSAYHQGTVWPWLVGHYVEAFIRVHREDKDAMRELLSYMEPLYSSHPRRYGLGSISEVMGGNAPHTPGGCPMQAWSVAETLRACEMLWKRLH